MASVLTGEAVAIGEIVAPIVARTRAMAELQSILSRIAVAEDRKRLIMTARECGAIEADDAELLVQAMMLETA